jgi:hypothetical protein
MKACPRFREFSASLRKSAEGPISRRNIPQLLPAAAAILASADTPSLILFARCYS